MKRSRTIWFWFSIQLLYHTAQRQLMMMMFRENQQQYQNTDDDGPNPLTGNDTADFTVTSVNDVPLITSTASTTASEDVQYSYSVQVTDPDDTNHGTGLNLISESSLLEGSNSGPVIFDGNHSSSSLWIYIENGYMPFGPAKLTDSQIEFIATWIDER